MIGGKYDLRDRYTHPCTHYHMGEDGDFVRCDARVPYWMFMCVKHGKDFAGIRCDQGEVHHPEPYYFSGQVGVNTYWERFEYPDIFMNRHINGVPSDAHG